MIVVRQTPAWLFAAYDNDMMLSIIHILHVSEIILETISETCPRPVAVLCTTVISGTFVAELKLSGGAHARAERSPCRMEYGDRVEELRGRYVLHLPEMIAVTLLPE